MLCSHGASDPTAQQSYSEAVPYLRPMHLSAIVAVSENGVIGDDNQIPWYLPADLKYFKRVTLGHPVIMGRKCFQSIGRALPKRLNVVMTRNAFFVADGVTVVHSGEQALEVARHEVADHDGEQKAFVIGGADIYRLFWAQTQTLYYTLVHTEVDGDIRFPDVDPAEWRLASEERHEADAKNPHAYTFRVYERHAPPPA